MVFPIPVDDPPRNVLRVKDQLEGDGAVVEYARQQADDGPQRFVLWGSSFSGSHVTTLASEASLNVLTVIAQCPYTSVFNYPPLRFGLLGTALSAIYDVVNQALGFPPHYISACALPGHLRSTNR
ncbi:hypothetical protein HGRIS_000993 [Hohenbuehelia grisea]|uniref:Uncharacterized protein n=1 Tax=Hohenbuehelia grisea TaxID=104357 RepID=A0ABR3IQI7_9AGAR